MEGYSTHSTGENQWLWRTYQLYVEKFYDLVRNNEFRKYDLKNYELKTGCASR